MPAAPAVILTEAARIIQERGRCTGVLFARPPGTSGPCCPLGAIAVAAGYDPRDYGDHERDTAAYSFLRNDEDADRAVRALADVLPDPRRFVTRTPHMRAAERVYAFNDENGRSTADVLEAMGRAAERAATA